MRIVSIGGGPAGLYFGILMKQALPKSEVTILERNRSSDTFGFGVVFSDATLENLRAADPESFREIARRFHPWDDIDVHYGNERLTSTGHGFCGISRRTLLDILGARCEELGVDVRYGVEVGDVAAHRDADLVLAADGANSGIRCRLAEHFRPVVDLRPNKFVWLGTTRPFPAFTFYFKESEHGLWRIHCYQYEKGGSTFIVETTDEAFRASGLEESDEDATIAFCEELCREELAGHRLLKNRSVWRNFPTIANQRWSWENVVLLGDAAHTAHFSVGSGTKLAMEDAITLVEQLAGNGDVAAALRRYEAERRPAVESLQRAAQASLQWFESTERYMRSEPVQFGFNLLTRSLRITHEDLKVRDPAYIRKIDEWCAARAGEQVGAPVPERPGDPIPPPMFTPFRLRGMVVPNRVVVSAMCQYSSADGMPDDWHLVHLGSRAIGGAGLVFSEMTDVSPAARITPGCAGMWSPEHVRAWKRIVDFVHGNTESKIGLQLAHAGRKGSTKLAWEGIDEPLPAGGWPLLSASPIPWFPHSPVPKEMDRADMDGVHDDFVRAAEMAEAAGFDIVELHFAHGYLLASFISPLTNVRRDGYGGALRNRMRFPLEVLDAVRAVWPAHKPLSVRISAVDWTPDGMGPGDAVQVAALLKEHGCDIVDVSAGQTVPHAKPVYGRQFQTPFSDRIRREVGIATIAVGNISSYMDVNTIVAAGRADLCALARAHLWDPYWIRHAAHEQGWKMRWPDPYSTLEKYTPRFK
ncbi:MAG: bifunctional salicylyl-CoA 5-hydroxylase/oxidoreductase [bacterium]